MSGRHASAALFWGLLFLVGCLSCATNTGTSTPAGATCADGLRNDAETGVDCGGPDCNQCPVGGGCTQNVHCQSGWCREGFCATSEATGATGTGDATGTPGTGDTPTAGCTAGTQECVNANTRRLCDAGDRWVELPCSAPDQCIDGECMCVPACEGKTCGDDGCGGSCGTCQEATSCQDGICACAPQCQDQACGEDGCGGLCNGCLELGDNDGQTDTALGYADNPGSTPRKIACLVRYDLPEAGMILTEFTAGWMSGLVACGIPYDLVYIAGSDMSCDGGDESSWYTTYCQAEYQDAQVVGADLTPKPPYTALDVSAEIGTVVLSEKTVFLGAVFSMIACTDNSECECGTSCMDGWCYPAYFCPVDSDSDGAASYMMPVTAKGPNATLMMEAGALKQKETDMGAIPFRIRVKQAP